MRMINPPNAKPFGGIWLPETEVHLVDWMRRAKGAKTVDGKRTYQYLKLEAAMRYQPSNRQRIALDIGAHVGLWSMWMVGMFEYVEAFEPVPLFYEILPWNVTEPNYTLHRHALGDKPDTVSMNVPLESTGASHVADDRAAVNEKFDGEIGTWNGIKVVTLDSLEFDMVDFIKIDVEGWEPKVLRGGEDTIRHCKPNIIVECKGNDTAYGEAKNAAIDLLQSWGMRQRQVLAGDFIMGWP